jgi:hypothetical protein
MYDPGRRGRRPHLRRLAPLAGDAPRGAARGPRSISLRRARRHSARGGKLVRAQSHGRGRPGGRAASVRGVRARRALRAGPQARRDRAGDPPSGGAPFRHRERRGSGDVPARGRRPPARQRHRRQGGPRALRPPPAGQERRRARRHPPGTARRRGGNGRSARAAPLGRAAKRRPRRGRRNAYLRAPQARRRAGLHGERRLRGRVHRLARAADRCRP